MRGLEGVCSTHPETLTLFQTKICDFPYPISDLIKNLIPYFRPEALEPGAWPERVTSCYGTYTVVSVNIKREMVEIDTLIQTKTPKKEDTLWRSTYLYSLYKGLTPPPLQGRKMRCRLWFMTLAAYASETNMALSLQRANYVKKFLPTLLISPWDKKRKTTTTTKQTLKWVC